MPPTPDDNPLDCNGHGSHVAGTLAGYGEATRRLDVHRDLRHDAGGRPDADRARASRPGATIVPLKVFGCAQNATTDLVAEALDWAADPNGDGNPSDHLDIVNMSLGSNYTSPQDPDAVAASNAADLGIVVVAAAGNGGDVYDGGGSPGNSPDAIDVAAADQSDTIASFSARGIRGAGNLKPDLTAPGRGHRLGGLRHGRYRLPRERHLDGHSARRRRRRVGPRDLPDLVGAAGEGRADGHGGRRRARRCRRPRAKTAPPMRSGSGLLQADQAVSTSVLAYSGSEPAAVSISFGTVPVTTKTVTRHQAC